MVRKNNKPIQIDKARITDQWKYNGRRILYGNTAPLSADDTNAQKKKSWR